MGREARRRVSRIRLPRFAATLPAGCRSSSASTYREFWGPSSPLRPAISSLENPQDSNLTEEPVTIDPARTVRVSRVIAAAPEAVLRA